MAGLVPAIHVFGLMHAVKTWMPATSAGMTRIVERADRRSIKNCESLRALLLHHFKVLRRFGESFLAMKHARGKIEDCSPTKSRLRRVGIIVVASRV
jgi:hypothetical protein